MVSDERKAPDRGESADEAGEDARLVALVLGGRRDGFDSLVRRYQRRAVAVAYRLLGNAEDAADVAQDALLRGYRNLEQLTDHRRFGPWLMRIVSNLSLNYRRSRKSSLTLGLDESAQTGGAMRSVDGTRPVDADHGGAQAEADELRAIVDAAIEALPERQRMSLVLFSIEGMSQQEVADILDCSVELVKWNVFQARRQLKRVLASRWPLVEESTQ